MMGKTTHPKNITIPLKIIKISTKRPIIIKITLIIAPKTRESKLEKRTSKYLPTSNPFP